MREQLFKAIYDSGLVIAHDEELKGGLLLSYGEKSYIRVSSDTCIESIHYLHSLSHEFAHYQFYRKHPRFSRVFHDARFNWNQGYSRYFLFIWIDELIAWWFGYQICKKYNVNTKSYWHHAWKHFSTYLTGAPRKQVIKNRKPNDLQ
ncbi:hypothetical protein P4K96_27590 [Bacillus cereus]|uniref:hypothetical protein n=1 Tax=Paenibacillus melissococcoides TaxID=2912268 RepID=UPI0021C394D5|nr:hypothetical protein [Paenibacillus melissococcoides]MEB9897183.1 hypothetical protein [Bacillus cereus]CAH8721279.1 hypothetical protein HTL2_006279 [Paenibacillus melissococcoides]